MPRNGVELLNRYAGALFFVAVAMIIRDNFLDNLGGRIVWVTFYPAVMAASLYGGFWAGVLAAGASCFGAVYMWDIFSHQPFIKDSGDWLGLVVFFINGTLISGMGEASRRSKARAEKARVEAEAANKAKSTFLATMSHELRTPLNAILGFSELTLKDRNVPEEQRTTFGIINKSGLHLLNLINDVLDMARVEAGKIKLESAPCDIPSLLHDLGSMMRQRAEVKGLAFTVEITSNVPRVLNIDEAKVHQILVNLAGNAIKFTAVGQVRIRADYVIQDNRSILVFEVQDSGVGISAADLPRIFMPFEQVGNNCSKKEGTGLGLAISHQFAELMRGVLTATSTAGVGSLFRFEVPADEVSDYLRTEKISRGTVVGIEAGQTCLRILIVEDEPANSLLLKQLLERIGLQVRIAENGQQGIAVFQEWRPDFIWMDCRMPVMDGLETTRIIRSMEGGADVRIVALTASIFKEERATIMTAGMDAFMLKPIKFDAVYCCMEEQLGLRLIREQSESDAREAERPKIDLNALHNLGEHSRLNLRSALKSLDQEQILNEISLLREKDPTLASTLSLLVEDLRYTALLKALDASESTEDTI